jgi:aryl-alcohol dehydrogenase-like predicted oxidoreductase
MDGLPKGDIRVTMPRFIGENFAHNLALVDQLGVVAAEGGHTPAQLALAWVLAQGDDVVSIPGTTRLDHLEENLRAESVPLTTDAIARLNALINPATVSGARYNPAVQAEIDTEEIH